MPYKSLLLIREPLAALHWTVRVFRRSAHCYQINFEHQNHLNINTWWFFWHSCMFICGFLVFWLSANAISKWLSCVFLFSINEAITILTTQKNKTQQYVPCSDQNGNKAYLDESSKPPNGSTRPPIGKLLISAPAATITWSSNKAALSLSEDAVQAVANAAIATDKKE